MATKRLLLNPLRAALIAVVALGQTPAPSPAPKMSVEPYFGVPTLHVDGKPTAGRAAYFNRSVTEGLVKAFGDAGVEFVSFIYTGVVGPRGSSGHAWVKRDVFDFSDFDDRVKTVLKGNPATKIFPRVDLSTPQWWLDENPGELMVYHDGTTMKPQRSARGGAVSSWASKKWREDTALYLRKLIEHIAVQPYAASVVGYHLAAGGTQEWYYPSNYKWFDFAVNEDILDYSRPQTEAFREHLRVKYRTVDAMRSAWHNGSVTFENAAIAPKADKFRPDWGAFFDPSKKQNVIDTFDFEGEMVADTIIYFCKVVKEATGGRAMTGAFYGYVTGAPDKAYYSTYKVLQSPYVDFLCAPSDYDFREPGSGYSTYRTLARSVQLHKKLWWDENDYRTFFVTGPRELGQFYVAGAANDLPGTETQEFRQLANQVEHASAAWWFFPQQYAAPDGMRLISRLNEIAERSVHADRSSVAEVAVVVDEKSLNCLDLGWNLYRPLIQEQRLPFGRIGAPVDWILMDDLDVAPAYKVYVFLDAFRVTESQKQSVRRLYSRGARALVWVYAPGLVGAALDGKESLALTGIKLKLLFDTSPLQVDIDPAAVQALPGVSRGWRYGTENKLGPVMVGDDPGATVLGTLFGYGEPGLVVKRVNGVQAYFSSAPKLPDWLLRSIVMKAGVHIYNPQDDGLYVNKSFLGIHTTRPGKRVLRFLAPVDLYDLRAGKSIARRATTITLDLPVRYSGLYFLGSEQEWNSLGNR
jgi:hypothetical protein